MATYDASIRRARRSQDDLRKQAEHCSADPERLASIGRARGEQVRIRIDEREFALYTVSEVRREDPDTRVRMGPAGRARLDAKGEFAAAVDSRVPHPTASEARAAADGELVERLRDDGRQARLIAIAPHGGAIEPFTDLQAERVRSRLGAGAASAWRCKGWGGARGAHERWHITSTDIHEASFPRLGSVIARGFAHAVAFHGLLAEEILIGGRAPTALKRELRDRIERATAGSGIPVRVAGRGEPSNGNHRRNIVNRLTAGGDNGIQIEQGPRARCHHWRPIADAVAEVYRDRI